MRLGLRLNSREKATIMDIRLDSLLSQRVLYELPQISELFEALIFYADYELGYNRKLANEIAKHFFYKKNMPLKIQLKNQEISKDQNRLLEEEIIDNESEEEFSALQISYNPNSDDSTFSGNLSPLVDEKIDSLFMKIFNVQDPNEMKISNSELLKGLVYFLVNDIAFQTQFRIYMYIGSLYGLKYNEMGALLDGVISAIDEEKFVSFRDAFIKDYDLFNAYLNNELEWKNKILKNNTGEFMIFSAVENYFILFFMTRMIRFNFPYFTYLYSATYYRDEEQRKYEDIKKIAKPVLSYLLFKIKIILEDSIRNQNF